MQRPRVLSAIRRRPLRWLAVGAVVVLLVVVGGVGLFGSDTPQVATRDSTIEVPAGPGESGTVALDTRLYLPAQRPAPAVLLAHGFGGSKDSVAAQANRLAQQGVVVLTYSARGFGASTGSISVNDPDREIADARNLVSWLAQRPEVQQDAPGDPHVGVAGSSYGGALALMLGGTDPRVDAIAAGITWNDLDSALFPNYAAPNGGAAPAATPAATVPDAGPGVLKRAWAGVFFGVGNNSPNTGGGDPECGRFAPEFCRAYQESAVTGFPSPAMQQLLRAHSPAAVAGAVRAPTLLVQGERDTLFGLDQADANARAIAAGGAPVQVRWFNGGHDGDADRADYPMGDFLLKTLRDGSRADSAQLFGFALPGTPNEQGQVPSRRMSADDYPGLPGTAETARVPIAMDGGADRPQSIVRPPGGAPTAVSGVPGLGGGFGGAIGATFGADPRGQFASFRSETLKSPLTITGATTVSLRVAALSAPNEGVLFAKLYDVSGEGRKVLPGAAVSAIRLPAVPALQPVDLRVSLPAIAYQVPEGHHLELAVGTTDLAYAVPPSPASFSVALLDSRILVPSVPAAPTGRAVPLAPLIGIAGLIGGLAALGLGAAWRRRRRAVAAVDPEFADVPLAARNLSKVYASGFRAVDDVSFAVERGQVLGLLGPNGAGKTTTLRMLMGLITPTDGHIRVFGHPVTAGAPVLSRIGAFVEGPGLLPHLSGIANLQLYWRATGRAAEDARMDEVLDIADLGDAIHRKVRSYSHGMRQRLAIAQAMLGLPDLLVLDEPTNGLDPPQIRTMRDVLIRYADGGRTVVLSSHLLAEVEQTCTHVVVMNRGKVISAGPVTALLANGGLTDIGVDDPERARTALTGIEGLGRIVTTDGSRPGLRIDLGSVPAPLVVRTLVDSGVAVSTVAASSRLEDVFLSLVHDPRASAAPEQENER